METIADRPVLEINLGENRYSGTDGCNRYTGGLVEVSEEAIRFGMAAGTRMACPDMKVADQFNSLIPMARSYEISDMQLHLFDASGQEILVFGKTD
jgi:heat shock protein HslJ